MRPTHEQIKIAFQKLPDDLKEAISSDLSASFFKDITEKFGLDLKQRIAMGKETGLVMMGLVSTKEFIPNISGIIGGEVSKAKDIANEINTKIFQPVRESIRKVQGLNESTDDTTNVTFNTTSNHVVQDSAISPISPPTLVLPKPTPPIQAKTISQTSTTYPAENMIDDKLNNIVKLPAEEKLVDTLARQKGYKNIDPYREPI